MSSNNEWFDISDNNKVILVVDPVKMDILDASGAAETFYGWSRSELISMSLNEIDTLSSSEIETDMATSRHITKSGIVRKVKVSSLTVKYGGKEVMLNTIDALESTDKISSESIDKIYNGALEPMVLFKTSSDGKGSSIVDWNHAASEFFGEHFANNFVLNHIIIYDQALFNKALNQTTFNYYNETNITFKDFNLQPKVCRVGFTRMFFDSEFYVSVQIRPVELDEKKLKKRTELPERLNKFIAHVMNRNPTIGYFAVVRLSETDELFRSLGKEAYMKRLLAVGKIIERQIGSKGYYGFLDESILFFHTGVEVNENDIVRALKNFSDKQNNESDSQSTKVQCVAVTYHDEVFVPDYGLAHKMLDALENTLIYKKLSVITDADIRRNRLIVDLSSAVSNNELFLLYQPIIDITVGKIVSLEALVRWKHPEFGIIGPDEFIIIAEEINVISQIDRWVFDEVTSISRKYPVHINLSSQDFDDINFCVHIEEKFKANTSKIILELTETSNVELSKEIIDTLERINAKLSIDDFGTGYSSMTRLASMNVESIKIDKSFVMNSSTNIESASLCIEMIRLGRALNIDVIAEGAETIEQIRFLHRYGCHLIQGYAISKPLDYYDAIELDVGAFKMRANDKYDTNLIHENAKIDFSMVTIVELNNDDLIVNAPMSFSKYTGYSQQELLKMSIYDLVHEDDLESFRESYEQLNLNGHVENIVFYLKCASGERKCVSMTGKIGDRRDSTKYIYFEKSEIIEERIANMQGFKGAYNTLFYEVPLATIVWRKDFEIIEWNHQAELTFGWTRQEAVGYNLVKLLIKKSKYKSDMNVFHLGLAESSQDFYYNNVTKTGETLTCSWVNRVINDKDGVPQFYISIIKDVTKELYNNDLIKQLSYAIERKGYAVVTTDHKGTIISANSQFSIMNGYREDELIGRNINLVNSRELPRKVYDDAWNTISSGKTWEGAFMNKRKDGSVYRCNTTIVPVVSEWSKEVNFLGIQKVIDDSEPE